MEKMHAAFDSFDVDHSKAIDKQEAIKHWSVNKFSFGKQSAMAFFEAVDLNQDGSIDFKEFQQFWEVVKAAGHTEEEICEELVRIKDGESWVGFSNLPKMQKSHSVSHNKKSETKGPVKEEDEPVEEQQDTSIKRVGFKE